MVTVDSQMPQWEAGAGNAEGEREREEMDMKHFATSTIQFIHLECELHSKLTGCCQHHCSLGSYPSLG